MRFVCSFWIICLCCCFAQERSPFESGIEPVELSLSLHCSECLGTLHSTTLGISTIFSIALCLFTSSSSSFPAVGYALLPAVGCALLLSWVLGSPFPGCFFRLSPSMPALPVRDIGAAVPAGTAHVVRPCFCEGCLVVRTGHGPQAEVAQVFGLEPLVELGGRHLEGLEKEQQNREEKETCEENNHHTTHRCTCMDGMTRARQT